MENYSLLPPPTTHTHTSSVTPKMGAVFEFLEWVLTREEEAQRDRENSGKRDTVCYAN